jgi:type VI secretion system protein ImpK
MRAFPSNYELSQARADVVRDMINSRLVDKNRTRSQGKADSEPIESNASAEGKARNRRVEVTLLVPPEERDRELANSSGQGKQ